MAAALDRVVQDIRDIQASARQSGTTSRPRWPMIVLATPKGWTGPRVVDGQRVEGTFRAHQVPLSDPRRNPDHLALLEQWLKSYRPEELFDANGALDDRAAPPRAGGREAHGCQSARERRTAAEAICACLIFASTRSRCPHPARWTPKTPASLGHFLRDVISLNAEARNFRVFGPDETVSNRLDAVFEVTARQWIAESAPDDQWLAPDGRVMEILSEHQCQGWLEGYLLTGRHGVFNTYEAFVHIVDSMFNQHAKWLKITRGLPWRKPIASLNYLLSSHVWRQDHNGFTHQDPGFIDHAINKKAEVVRVYLPPDANCLLSVMDHCLRSRHYVNIVVAGKHPAPQWLRDGCRGTALRRRDRHLGLGGQRGRR